MYILKLRTLVHRNNQVRSCKYATDACINIVLLSYYIVSTRIGYKNNVQLAITFLFCLLLDTSNVLLVCPPKPSKYLEFHLPVNQIKFLSSKCFNYIARNIGYIYIYILLNLAICSGSFQPNRLIFFNTIFR